jgi:hypothetical protein
MVELVRRFATSPERAQILEGLLNYRDALRSIGVTSGYQWIDGSFVEDVETTRGRPPGDVDLVTVAHRPISDDAAWRALVVGNLHVFDPAVSKVRFKSDAYYIDLNKPPRLVVEDTVYFFGLFSHQKATFLWKGVLRIPLISDDHLARGLL